MNFFDWLGNKLKPPKAGTYDVTSYRIEAEETASSAMAIDAYAMFTVIGMIARLLSGCEFRTYRNNKEYHGEEWASLNYRPNKNQNAVEWKRELISKLLIEGEVLCIQLHDGQRIIADSFDKEVLTVYESKFTEVSRDGFTFDETYYSGDVIYLTCPINAKQHWLQITMQEYERLLKIAADRFEKSDGERGTLKVSALAQGDPKFEDKFKTLMEDYFKGYFKAKNAVLPLFDGYDYIPTGASKSGTYINDTSTIKTFADEALARAAQVFGIPASYIHGDAAGISDAQSAMLTNCIKPLASLIASEFTAKYYTLANIAKGDHIDVDTGTILHHDLVEDGEHIYRLVGAGWSHNEICRALGQPEIPEEWADEHFITANYETFQKAMTAEGGDGNAQNMGD